MGAVGLRSYGDPGDVSGLLPAVARSPFGFGSAAVSA